LKGDPAAASRERFAVELEIVVGHTVGGEASRGGDATRLTLQVNSVGDGFAERFCVTGWDEQPGASVLDQLGQAASGEADDRCAEGE
jgi:hypothetical protein